MCVKRMMQWIQWMQWNIQYPTYRINITYYLLYNADASGKLDNWTLCDTCEECKMQPIVELHVCTLHTCVCMLHTPHSTLHNALNFEFPTPYKCVERKKTKTKKNETPFSAYNREKVENCSTRIQEYTVRSTTQKINKYI